VIYVVSGTGTNLALRLLLNRMQKFQFFVIQSACFMYIPFTASFLLMDACRKRLRFRVILNREVNKRFLLMAFLDCIANFLVICGAAHTNLALQTLIPQAVIPVSMILGSVILGSTFTRWQITGATTVMVGVIIVCIPIVLSTSSNTTPLSPDFGFWTGMLFLSNVPLSLSALVKELVLHHRSRDVPVSYLNTAVSCLQLMIGFVLAPLGLAGVRPSQLASQLRDGYHCLLGSPSILTQFPECASGSVLEYLTFCILMFSMNISLLFVVRHGSSSIMYAASALVLPLSNLANTSSLLMGSSASPLDSFTLGGLGPILIGILLYANAKPTKEAEDHPAGLPVEYPEADVSLGKGLVGPGEKFYPIEKQRSTQDITLFDLDSLIPPRGVVGGFGVPPWMPILEEKSLIARWAVTAHTRGDLVSPLLRPARRRHSSPPSPLVDEIAKSPQARGHGIWIPSVGVAPPQGKEGFYEWGMQVEDFSGTAKSSRKPHQV
jgi:drug/metabolite transporter (DMT)-like permease